MRLIFISIRNFRCLKEVQSIPVHKLTVLIGENDAGKSSILDALDMALGTRRPPSPDDYYVEVGKDREKEICIELLFDVSTDIDKPPLNLLNANGALQYRVRLSENSRISEVKGKRYANPLLNQDFQKLKAGDFDTTLELLGIPLDGRRNNELRLQALQEYLSSSSPEMIDDWVEVRNQLDGILPRYEKYDTADFREPETMIHKTLVSVIEAAIYELEEDGQTMKLIKPLSDVKADLNKHLNTKIEELLSFVRTYNPKITGLSIDPIIDFTRGFQTGKLYLSDLTGTNHVLNKGEGTRKRLFMSILDWDRKVMLETSSRPVIRGYDEPDANLHYEAQRKMYYSLRDITHSEGSNVQAIICTHSITMIDRAPTKSINILKMGSDGKCQVEYLDTKCDKAIDSFLEDMSRTMGISNSSIFYERCFIFVEGPTEEHALPIFYSSIYNSSLIENGIRIIDIEGCGGWQNYVKLLGINKKNLILFFLDSDCNDPTSSCTLCETTLVSLGFERSFINSNVVYIGTKEFEDSICSTVYVNALNNNWPKHDGTPWIETDIDNLRASPKFSKTISEEVFKQSRMRAEKRCTKPKLGEELARNCEPANIPTQIIELFVKARGIAQVK